MPILVGAAVAGTMFAAGTTAAVVAAAAINGLIVGALVGAATALVTGGNVLEGALKGGFIGAVTGGIAGYAGTLGTAANVGAETASVSLETGADATVGSMMDPALGGSAATDITAGGASAINPNLPGGPSSAKPNVPGGAVSEADKLAQLKIELAKATGENTKALIYGNAASGLMQGAGDFMAANKQASAAEDQAAAERQSRLDLIAANKAAPLDQWRFPDITLPDVWLKASQDLISPLEKRLGTYANYGGPKTGLLQGGAA